MAALQFEIRGMVKGHPAIVIEHVTRLRPDLRPDWPSPPRATAPTASRSPASRRTPWTSCPSSRKGDHNHAAIAGAAGRVVNAIPAVIAAPPGIRTTLDLPLVTGKGLYAPSALVAT